MAPGGDLSAIERQMFEGRDMKKLLVAACVPLVLMVNAEADVIDVTVEDAWTRATVPAQRATGAFMQLKASSEARLVGAESDVAEVTEIHQMSMEDEVMRMREIEALELPAGEWVKLEPGGHHIMLLDLHGQIKEDDEVNLVLTLENANGEEQTLDVVAPARSLTHRQTDHDHHGHEMDESESNHHAHDEETHDSDEHAH